MVVQYTPEYTSSSARKLGASLLLIVPPPFHIQVLAVLATPAQLTDSPEPLYCLENQVFCLGL